MFLSSIWNYFFPQKYCEEWRKITWGNNQADLRFVKNYRPQVKNRTLRILLHGPQGAGKSSFINSVQSVLMGRIYSQALANNYATGGSFTNDYSTYKERKADGSFYPFVFSDIMGLSEGEEALEEDVKLVLRGHVKEGYTFDPDKQLCQGDKFYQETPNANDKVSRFICVIPADKIEMTSDEVVDQIRRIREDASSLHIPQIAIITKIDELDPDLQKDVKKVYKLKSIKEKMQKFSSLVGIPMNRIFPVKNYHEEIDMNTDVDSLILSAMRHILNCGNDCINFHHNRA
ncbi:interferon-induced protein 44-like [Poeciliopsis prolifica]|uniref:interferon-induced protein 44-like n=1 Tax=Poeciliopsis prolifica TaxID=188132 RepID=UPI0024142CC7|nr:interferon-induced protein 44-like [Poeciliopsis prolifica]